MTVLLIGRGKAQPPPTYWHHSPSHDKVNQHWRHCEETVDRVEGRTNVEYADAFTTDFRREIGSFFRDQYDLINDTMRK